MAIKKYKELAENVKKAAKVIEEVLKEYNVSLTHSGRKSVEYYVSSNDLYKIDDSFDPPLVSEKEFGVCHSLKNPSKPITQKR